MPASVVAGEVAPGYEPVRKAFEHNFAARGELGAACAIFAGGRKVVDLWGGFRETVPQRRWEHDTPVLVYSLTKGMTALVAATAVSRGLFAYEMRVADIWPEFAAQGKQAVTVRQLLSEQAGLAAVDVDLTLEDLADPLKIARQLAAQTPDWTPGDRSGNHAYSLGWLVGELIRRTDPRGRTLGSFFHEEIAKPLGLADQFYIGLPATVPESRLARIDGFKPYQMLLHPVTLPPGMLLALLCPWSLTSRTLNNPKLSQGPAELDQRKHWSVEDGGAGGIGTARALATIYHAFVTDSPVLRRRREVLQALAEQPVDPRLGIRDAVLKTNVRYSLGLEKPCAGLEFGTSHASFGTFAVGGSFAYGDPAAGVGYAYVTNRLGFYKWSDPREWAVRKVFSACLEADRGNAARPPEAHAD